MCNKMLSSLKKRNVLTWVGGETRDSSRAPEGRMVPSELSLAPSLFSSPRCVDFTLPLPSPQGDGHQQQQAHMLPARLPRGKNLLFFSRRGFTLSCLGSTPEHTTVVRRLEHADWPGLAWLVWLKVPS